MSKKKLRVFVDAEVLIVPHFSGIGHYTLELLRAVDRALEDRHDIEVTLGVYFRQVPKILSYGFKNFKIRRSPFPPRISNGLKVRHRQPYLDLLFGKRIYIFPNFTSWPLRWSRSITFVYDISFELYPQFVEPNNRRFLSNQVKLSVGRSENIISISKSSRQELIDFYGLKAASVPIIYPGVDQTVFYRRSDMEINRVKAKYSIRGKYILFVGNLEPRKNLKNLLLAYEKLSEKIRNEYSLVLVGGAGWLDEEIFSTIKRLRKNGYRIQQPQKYVVDKDRPAIYSGASLFVFPSLYEGFGIPPVEAMACGVPVISANNSSLSEAVGKAAELIDADSVQDLAKAMEKLLGDSGRQAQMIEAGFKQVDRFSWDKSAANFIKILEDIGR